VPDGANRPGDTAIYGWHFQRHSALDHNGHHRLLWGHKTDDDLLSFFFNTKQQFSRAKLLHSHAFSEPLREPTSHSGTPRSMSKHCIIHIPEKHRNVPDFCAMNYFLSCTTCKKQLGAVMGLNTGSGKVIDLMTNMHAKECKEFQLLLKAV
jgi:hypothetical protein